MCRSGLPQKAWLVLDCSHLKVATLNQRRERLASSWRKCFVWAVFHSNVLGGDFRLLFSRSCSASCSVDCLVYWLDVWSKAWRWNAETESTSVLLKSSQVTVCQEIRSEFQMTRVLAKISCIGVWFRYGYWDYCSAWRRLAANLCQLRNSSSVWLACHCCRDYRKCLVNG